MKNFIKTIVLITICFQLNGCDLMTTEKKEETAPIPHVADTVWYASFDRYWFTINGIHYPDYYDSYDKIANTSNREPLSIGRDIPYGYSFKNLTAYFAASEGAKVYINDVEQISGVTVNDFTNPVDYKIISKDGIKENIIKITVEWLPNTEAILYWLKVTAGGTVYTCVVDQTNKKITLSVPTGTNLNTVILEYKISDNAGFFFGTHEEVNGGISALYFDPLTITIKAENGINYTDYTLVKTFY